MFSELIVVIKDVKMLDLGLTTSFVGNKYGFLMF